MNWMEKFFEQRDGRWKQLLLFGLMIFDSFRAFDIIIIKIIFLLIFRKAKSFYLMSSAPYNYLFNHQSF